MYKKVSYLLCFTFANIERFSEIQKDFREKILYKIKINSKNKIIFDYFSLKLFGGNELITYICSVK